MNERIEYKAETIADVKARLQAAHAVFVGDDPALQRAEILVKEALRKLDQEGTVVHA
jgi:hypothetical protein